MNWIALKSLNEVYYEGKTDKKKTLLKDPDIQHLVRHTKELHEYADCFVKGNGFDKYYERYHKSNYIKYHDFLVRNNLEKPQTRFEESDIQILMDIEERMSNSDLLELRDQIIKAHETVRGVSLMFFKNEKYLLNRLALVNAVKQLLKIEELADEKDQQYKYVLECENPKLIVLCENIDFLKRPYKPRKHNIELWYAGGKNIDKLDYVDIRGLSIYYSCDWDYDGLKVFEAVKRKIPEIQLLYPNGNPKSIEYTEHKSHWKSKHDPDELSELNKEVFKEKEKYLIQLLIETNQWIVEESNDLIEMVYPITVN